MKSGQIAFVADGGLMNFDVGFKPSYIELISALGGTELMHRFYRVLADNALAGQYGIIDNGAGVLSANSSGSGIILYEEGEDIGVMLISPASGKKIISSVLDWTSARSTAATARSATVLGTVLRPTTHNGRVYECTTAGTSSGTEPTDAVWDVEPGETVADNDVRFTCRLEENMKSGGQGFAVEAGISTDSEIWVARFVADDIMEDVGDVDGFDPIRLESNKR